MKKSQRDKKIYKIIDIVKNEINNDNSLYQNLQPISNEVIKKKRKYFCYYPKKARQSIN